MARFMKTKKGFTLTELLLIVAIIGIIIAIAVPIYNGFTKTARIRSCRVERMKAQKQAESWCKDNFFNADYEYKIVSDGEKGVIGAVDGKTLSADEIANLTDNIHQKDIPFCPSCGTFIVVVEARPNATSPRITVTCDGGDDGDCHGERDE